MGYIDENAKTSRGKYGYSEIGAMVWAIYPKEPTALRRHISNSHLLVSGYGTQEARRPIFNKDRLGAVVCVSRNALFAFEASCGKLVRRSNFHNRSKMTHRR